MSLNRKQRVVIFTAALLVAATGIYPPWHTKPFMSPPGSGFGTKFSLIFLPRGTLAVGTLAAEWFVILVLAGALLLFFQRKQKE